MYLLQQPLSAFADKAQCSNSPELVSRAAAAAELQDAFEQLSSSCAAAKQSLYSVALLRVA